MTSVAWVFRRRWHPERTRFARLRALLLVLSGYETEICGRCGGKVEMVWHAPDDLWLHRSGFPTPGGVLCVPCFDELAGGLYWVCAEPTAEIAPGEDSEDLTCQALIASAIATKEPCGEPAPHVYAPKIGGLEVVVVLCDLHSEIACETMQEDEA